MKRAGSINGETMTAAPDVEQISLLGDRKNNQDRAASFADQRRVLLVVADGMGGHAEGAEAARLVVEQAEALFHEHPTLPAAQLMQRIALHAHQAISQLRPELSEREQPRTTVVMLHCQDGKALFAHAGDSRGYLIRERQELCRTRDHSVVASLIERGAINAAQAREHPLRNQVTRCLGGLGRPTLLELTPCPALQAGDRFLLCSDGFWEPLSQEEAFSDRPLDALAETAVDRKPGRADNCTALRFRLHTV